MDTSPPLTQLDRLYRAADCWTAAHEASRARLARLVVNDTGFFSRLESGKANPTLATLERFARFFADGANWPDGRVPAAAEVEVAAFCHVNGVSLSDTVPATGTPVEMSGSREKAA